MPQKIDLENSRTPSRLAGERMEGRGEAGEPEVAGAPAAEGRRLARPRAKRVAVAALVVLATAGTILWRHYAGRESTDDAQIDGDIYPISPRVGGHAIAVEVENNLFVNKGDVLFRLDPTDYQVALERAKADYATALARAEAMRTGVPITSVNSSSQISSAEAGVERAQAGLSAAEKEYDAAQARVSQSQADSAKAQSDLSRYEQLVKKDEVSRQQYDHALETARSEAAKVTAAQAAALAARQDVLEARGRLAQAEADLRSSRTGPERVRVSRAEAQAGEAAAQMAKSNLDQAELNLQYTTVRAPASGLVGRKSVVVGQNVEAGQALMAIVPLQSLYVTANFKENQLRHIRPGNPAVIHVDAYNRDYQGHVLNVAGSTGERFSLLPPENATGNYVKVVQRIPVKILFEKGQDPEHRLRIGMSVEPTVITR